MSNLSKSQKIAKIEPQQLVPYFFQVALFCGYFIFVEFAFLGGGFWYGVQHDTRKALWDCCPPPYMTPVVGALIPSKNISGLHIMGGGKSVQRWRFGLEGRNKTKQLNTHLAERLQLTRRHGFELTLFRARRQGTGWERWRRMWLIKIFHGTKKMLLSAQTKGVSLCTHEWCGVAVRVLGDTLEGDKNILPFGDIFKKWAVGRRTGEPRKID